MNDNRKNEITALGITLLLCVVMVLILVNTFLRYQPIDNTSELKQDSIMFGGEYVMLGDMVEAIESDDMASDASIENAQDTEQPDVEGDDMRDNGEPTKQPTQLVTANKESPMKVKEKVKEDPTKKSGPAVDKKNTDKKEEVKQTTNSATNNRVKNAFGNTGGTGTGKQGSPDGNSGQGPTIGRPGLGGLVGYTLDYWAKPNPNSRWTGTVQVKVRVSPRGKVTEAHAVGGSGEAYTHAEIRHACEQAALKSAFSVPTNTTTEGVGTVTYKWN